MAIVQVKDAEGSVLDWMVAKCEGTPSVRMFENSKGFRVYKTESMKMQGINFAPSTVWDQGGPIIGREQIGLDQFKGQPCRAYLGTPVQFDHAMFAPEGQPLIAAMRCYVSSVLGEEVEVPDELI